MVGFALPRSACGGGFALPRSAWGGGFALGLGLCRGSPTRGLVYGAMGGGHMWRRKRDLGLFIEIWVFFLFNSLVLELWNLTLFGCSELIHGGGCSGDGGWEGFGL
jgi:hypothetical protein